MNLKSVGLRLMCLVAVMSFAITTASAAEVNDFDALSLCLTSEEEATCTLAEDITFTSNIIVKGTKSLDLNNHTLILGDSRIAIDGGNQADLTVVDSGENGTVTGNNVAFQVTYGGVLDLSDGTINASQGISAWGYEDPNTTKTSITVGEDVVINVVNSVGNGAGIVVFYDTKNGTYGVVVDFYGTINAGGNNGITINGNVNRIAGESLPVFNIYDTAVIDAPTGVSIYGGGYAIWNIYGGTISGAEALSIKSGVYHITGGELHATGEYFDPSLEFNNGSELTGAAISVTGNSRYAGNVELYISNVTAKSDNGYALYEGISVDEEGTPSADSSSIKSIIVQLGEFTGAMGAVKISSSDSVNSFVEGGTYNTEIDTNLVKDGYLLEKSGESYVVNPNLIISTDDEDVTFESDEPLPNDYKLVVEEEELANEEAVMESVNKQINTALEEVKEELLDSKLVATYDISVKDSSDQVVKLANGNYAISIKVTEDQVKGYNAFKVVYINDEGEVAEVLDAVLEEGAIKFETTHLSTYAIIGYNTVTLTEDGDDVIGDGTDTPTNPEIPGEETPEVPQTFDSLTTYIVGGVVSVIAIAGAILYIKRKQTN